MTSRRDLQAKLHQLHEVREILSSMKNLAYMETRKIAPRLEAQQEAVRLIESAAADLLAHVPELRAPERGTGLDQTVVIVGSERGFCGGFNEQLVQAIGESPARLIAVGRKLAPRIENDARFGAAVEGAVVAEDAESIIVRLVPQLGMERVATVTVLFHDEGGTVTRLPLLPPFREPPRRDPRPPPLLHLPPPQFFVELVDQYLFAALHLILLASLLAENQQRVRHLEGAVERLDDQWGELERRRHRMRQEEITEEIEVILLNADL